MSRTVPVRLNVNGEQHHLEVEPRLLLVHALRDHLGLTGAHVGCDTSNCGACTVHLDGRAVKSCTVLAVQADGAAVTTIEGLGSENDLHPVQEAFWNDHGLQCGYCTPGMIMAATALLAENPNHKRPFVVLDEGDQHMFAGLCGKIWAARPVLVTPVDRNELSAWRVAGTARVLFAQWEAPTASGAAFSGRCA